MPIDHLANANPIAGNSTDVANANPRVGGVPLASNVKSKSTSQLSASQ
jgi:hypothetical protein